MNGKFWKDPRTVADSLVRIPRPLSPAPADLPELPPEKLAEGDMTAELC